MILNLDKLNVKPAIGIRNNAIYNTVQDIEHRLLGIYFPDYYLKATLRHLTTSDMIKYMILRYYDVVFLII